MGPRRLAFLLLQSAVARQMGAQRFAAKARQTARVIALKRQRIAKRIAIAVHGLVSDDLLLEQLRIIGICEGDVVFVQSSFASLYTYAGKVTSLLAVLRRAVGPEGTLLMPAFTTTNYADKSKVVDLERIPTYTGLLNEVFRRTPGVLRIERRSSPHVLGGR